MCSLENIMLEWLAWHWALSLKANGSLAAAAADKQKIKTSFFKGKDMTLYDQQVFVYKYEGIKIYLNNISLKTFNF